MNTQEKSKVIAGKVGIKGERLPVYAFNAKRGDFFHYPDFFTPEGQVVLAKALLADKELAWKVIYREKHMSILTLIAETGLAELFYEFIESEGKNEGRQNEVT